MTARYIAFLLLWLVSVGAFAQSNPQSNDQLYVNSHTVKSVDFEDIVVEDVLSIDRSNISFELHFDNGASCSMTSKDKNVVTTVVPGGFNLKYESCQLEIRKVGAKMELHDRGDRCQPYFCGASAAIANASFQISE